MQETFLPYMLGATNNTTISFAGGLPDDSLFPIADLKNANMKIYDDNNNLQYSTKNGLEKLREHIAKFYNAEAFTTQADNILITTGSQQALYIISKYFQNKNIVLEAPSYLGALNAFKINNLTMQPIELYHDGIKMDTFKDSFEKTKLAYLIPDFQNPTGSFYSQKKREEIAQITLENEAYIIEDAPYSQLYFENKIKSISSMIPNNSLHLGSFSKTLSPGIRIGWIRGNKDLIKKLATIKEAIDLHSGSIAQHTLYHYLSEPLNNKIHLDALRESYKAKLDFFVTALREYLPLFEFTKPLGGMFIYGRIIGIDTFDFVHKCIKENVIFVPGNQFYLDKEITNEIRFNFTYLTKKNVKKGLIKINAILEKIE